mmetsp:Transcript_68173/g.215660  ORF Transcript_68173/g.215660 Transcript_68173/m.215660 type:complete len:245 (-) Transcript_68173:857-1591(-)|eukprot:CAMPEP_0182879584 /NCGR_PEP_ID=MMETSP0034_2-20130328/16065_1 /TAXON_ID=156128 /ORGANISM="Nephroselmis pyriformis, Strain CCMP717" /LENGTH=244 /DNA_ID=CAMNT_0025012535 /DNA_START=46 /DNA_END=780 /DNA_ORIENTATION=+
MASAQANDPFYLVRDEIQDSVDGVVDKFSKWDRLPEGAEKVRLCKEVEHGIDSASWQLEELDKAIGVAEKDPLRFGVDADEVASRRKWTTATRAQVTKMSARIAEEREFAAAAAKRIPDPSAASGSSSYTTRLDSAIAGENDGYMASEGDQQALLMRKQDEALDDLSKSVARIGDVGLTISEELEAQTAMLDELDEDVEGTRTRLGGVQRKMTQVIQKSGMRGQMAMIGFLVVLLIILVVLVFS